MLTLNKNCVYKINKNQNSLFILKEINSSKKFKGNTLPFDVINSQSLYEIIKTVSPERIPKRKKFNQNFRISKKLNKDENNKTLTKDNLFLKIPKEDDNIQKKMSLSNPTEDVCFKLTDNGLKSENTKIIYEKIDENSPILQLNYIKEQFDYNRKELLGQLLLNDDKKFFINEAKQTLRNDGNRNLRNFEYFKQNHLSDEYATQYISSNRRSNNCSNFLSNELNSQNTKKNIEKIKQNSKKNNQLQSLKKSLKQKIELKKDPTKIPEKLSDYKIWSRNLTQKFETQRKNRFHNSKLLGIKCKKSFNEEEFDMNLRINQIVQGQRNNEVFTKKQINKKISNFIFAKLIMNDFSIVNKVNNNSKERRYLNTKLF